MARASEELVGIFSYEKNVFGKADERAIVGVLEDETQIKGRAGENDLQTGLTYLFRGYWTVHLRFGKQFQFYSFAVAQPAGQRGTVSYLTRGPGIGPARARQMWEIYGQDALDAIRSRPEEVAAKVKGLTTDRAKEAAAYFQAHKDREIVTRDLEELLSGGGFPKRLIDKLIERYGAKAAAMVRERPWLLMKFPGVGYGRTEKLYLQMGGAPDAVERLGWCAHNALHKDRSGSTWVPLDFGRVAIVKGVAGVEVKPMEGIEWAIQHGHIARRVDKQRRVWITEGERAADEARLASQVHRAIVEGSKP